MAITPTSGPNLSQVGKYMQNQTEATRKERLKLQGGIHIQKRQARQAKPTARQRSKEAAKRGEKHGSNLDVRA